MIPRPFQLARSVRFRAGFTLVELLVVIAVLALLASLLLASVGKAKNRARRTVCISNLHQIGVATAVYLSDFDDRMPFVADSELQLTPPVDESSKRYARMGSFMPLFAPYVGDSRIWISPPARMNAAISWQTHFRGVWRRNGMEELSRGFATYLSDKLAELDSEKARYLRGRSPESCALRRGSSVAEEEWLMSPFFEKPWWPKYHPAWSIGDSVPPSKGWSAHDGGRNQLYLDLHAAWVRREIDR